MVGLQGRGFGDLDDAFVLEGGGRGCGVLFVAGVAVGRAERSFLNLFVLGVWGSFEALVEFERGEGASSAGFEGGGLGVVAVSLFGGLELLEGVLEQRHIGRLKHLSN